MTTWFNKRKAAQVAAFFAKQEGNDINVLKLTKLIYLADREHMEKFDYPITGDELVSMPHGPVNSLTSDLINGCQSNRNGWDEFIADRAGYNVGLAKAITLDDLDELSDAEIATLQEVWAKFGHMSKYEIRDWTHDNCLEWEDPNGSSNPIPYERVFKCLGKKHASELVEKIKTDRNINEIFATQ